MALYLRVCDDAILSDGTCPSGYRVLTNEEVFQTVTTLDQQGYYDLLLPTLVLFATAFGIRALRRVIWPKS